MKNWPIKFIVATIICAGLAVSSLAWGDDTGVSHAGVRSAVRLVVELASDVSAEQVEATDAAIAVVADRVIQANAEELLAENLLTAPPDRTFTIIVAAQARQPVDYLRAMRQSFGRSAAAEQAGDREWVAKHRTAARKYASLAADALTVEATEDEKHAAELQNQSFAVRRSPERAAAFLDELKRNGLSAGHRRLALAGGYSEAELDAYLKDLLDEQPDKLGLSMVEFLTNIARSRRALAAQLEEFAKTGAAADSGPKAQIFTLANPHDDKRTVDLYIHRASMPPNWKVSLVSAADPKADTSAPRPQEIEAGRHYRVTLPAKGQIKVASVVVPVGVVAENTTARWAVEGWIGNELLGGIVHEMHVPAMLPDLKLPEIGASDSPTTDSPATGTSGFQWHVSWVIAGVSLLVGAIAFLFWRRRHART
jgi:hypothetical protein